ncbi:hypothetical protein [Kitasatospora sp. McL0602]|uniref:hypothetical protein n=1 Tax=Kitasatospora sp. McL0602 TaxID=3439530 RepID=UPI003F88B4F9
MAEFIDASVELTGFDAGELRATGMADRYHAAALEHLGAALLRLLTAPAETGGEADGEALETARAVTHLWYTGSWPGAATHLSAETYAQGLVWRAFDGTAPGIAPQGHGSWAEEPPEAAGQQR